ncbi:MAG TPA: hypothetical protein VHQ70_06630 [Syntrophomonadaceae bacterium]|nr:hypothetical protein [Syntrophomonadaceae bacterium]
MTDKSEREFSGGKEDWDVAAQLAENCSEFKADDEDEIVADEPVSCYNCRFRRWTRDSFVCCK